MKKLCYCFFFWVQMSAIQAQIPDQIITSDIDHYWEAYDSILAKPDYAQKVAIMNRLYIDRGSDVRYIKITFSKPMEDVSFNFSIYGPEHFPLANIAGYENDNRTIILETVALQPKTTYDFYVNDNNTQSKDGYKFPIKAYKIEFETQ